MTDDQLIAAFDDCLRAMEAGASLEAALARHPQFTDELRPMLLAAQAARPAQPLRVPSQSEAASHARLLARARELRKQRRPGFSFWPQLTLAARLALIALVVVLGGFGAASASAPALPGDTLYTLKRAVEQTQLTFADAVRRAALEQQFEQRRLAETQAVVAQRRETEVEFTGLVQAITGERWLIAGLAVQVRAGLAGEISLGDTVKVWGRTQADGVIVATRLEKRAEGGSPAPTLTPRPTQTPSAPTSEPGTTATGQPQPIETRRPTTPLPTATQPMAASPTSGVSPEPTNTLPAPSATFAPSVTPTLPASVTPPPTGTDDGDDGTETPGPEETDFDGVVEATGGVWVIGGQAVVVNAQTEFRGNPQLGDQVEVKAWRLTDGTLVARRIEKKN